MAESKENRFKKSVIAFFVMFGVVFVSICVKEFIIRRNEESKVGNGQSKSFKAVTEWNSFNLENTDIKVNLPGQPKVISRELPAQVKKALDPQLHLYEDKDFMVVLSEMKPTAIMRWVIKDLADTNMKSFRRSFTGGMPSLTYSLDIKSKTNAKYIGSYTNKGKEYVLQGCCIIKADNPRRSWMVVTTYPKDNTDAANAAQRVIDSVIFTGSTEICK